jgi:hypothetical protein
MFGESKVSRIKRRRGDRLRLSRARLLVFALRHSFWTSRHFMWALSALLHLDVQAQSRSCTTRFKGALPGRNREQLLRGGHRNGVSPEPGLKSIGSCLSRVMDESCMGSVSVETLSCISMFLSRWRERESSGTASRVGIDWFACYLHACSRVKSLHNPGPLPEDNSPLWIHRSRVPSLLRHTPDVGSFSQLGNSTATHAMIYKTLPWTPTSLHRHRLRFRNPRYSLQQDHVFNI